MPAKLLTNPLSLMRFTTDDPDVFGAFSLTMCRHFIRSRPLHQFITDLCKPPLEWFSLSGNRLGDPEQGFCCLRNLLRQYLSSGDCNFSCTRTRGQLKLFGCPVFDVAPVLSGRRAVCRCGDLRHGPAGLKIRASRLMLRYSIFSCFLCISTLRIIF
jgi:hypothetical protein